MDCEWTALLSTRPNAALSLIASSAPYRRCEEKVRQEVHYREKRLHDEANALGGARKEGIAEGIEIGRPEE